MLHSCGGVNLSEGHLCAVTVVAWEGELKDGVLDCWIPGKWDAKAFEACRVSAKTPYVCKC